MYLILKIDEIKFLLDVALFQYCPYWVTDPSIPRWPIFRFK